MLTQLTFDRAVGRVDTYTGKFGAPFQGNHSQLTQSFGWGTGSGDSFGCAGGAFDGDAAGPNTTDQENHPYSAVHQRDFGSLSSFH